MSPRRGPELPYSVVAGVTPVGPNWLVASAKLHGVTFVPEAPKLYPSLLEVLSEHPSFVTIVLNAPIGYLDAAGDGVRRCDREARAILGNRAMTIHNAPTRDVLQGSVTWIEGQLDAVTATLLPSYREVAAEISAFRQRVVYQGHPELSFFQINADNPLRRSKQIAMGRDERRAILEMRIPGVDVVLDAELPGVPRKHLFDVAALLWTARRVFAHAAREFPRNRSGTARGSGWSMSSRNSTQAERSLYLRSECTARDSMNVSLRTGRLDLCRRGDIGAV